MKYIDKPELKRKKGSKVLAFAFAAIAAFSSGAVLTACDSKEPPIEQNPPIVTPGDPETPVNPVDPEKPVDPVDPDLEKPVDPDKPVDPVDPDPEKPVDPTPEFKFDPSNPEHITKLVEQMQPTVAGLVKHKYPNTYHETNPKLLQVYLNQKQNHVDTVGFVIGLRDGYSILHSELYLKNLENDITWENLCKNGMGIAVEDINFKNGGINHKQAFGATIQLVSGSEQIDLEESFKKVYGNSYNEDALVKSWVPNPGPSTDRHNFKILVNNNLLSCELSIKNNDNGSYPVKTFLDRFFNAENNQYYTLSELTTEKFLPDEIYEKTITIPKNLEKEIEQNL